MNIAIYYIFINIPNIQHHKLLCPITNQTKKNKEINQHLQSKLKVINLFSIFDPTTEINNLPLN
jgi:hypothetical protein